MRSVFQLLEIIRERPALYIHKNYISCLEAYLNGWLSIEPDQVIDYDAFADFEQWVIEKYRIETSHGWCSIILFHSGDEYLALQKFFVLLDEWKEKRAF